VGLVFLTVYIYDVIVTRRASFVMLPPSTFLCTDLK